MNNTEKTDNQWLKNLQENSWQMELFISGGAIFSLFQASSLLIDWAFTARMTVILAGTGFGVILSMLGIKLLTVGFFTHLVLRAYWISIVCLNDVFPLGSKKVKLAYPFSIQKPHQGNLVHQISKLDQYAGLVFFFSIISTLIILGTLVLTFLFLSIPSEISIGENTGFIQSYVKIIFILLGIYYLDLLLFGFIRKTKYLSFTFFPIIWLFDRLTLRFLYEIPLQVYGSNINKFKAGLVFLGFFAVSAMLCHSALQTHMGYSNLFDSREYLFSMTDKSLQVYQNYYMDELEKKGNKAGGPVIQSMIIKDNYLKLFIPYKSTYDFYLSKNSTQTIADLIHIILDNDTIYQINWHNFHAFEFDQVGLIGIVDIQHLTKGKHQITIGIKDGTTTVDGRHSERKITFWKD